MLTASGHTVWSDNRWLRIGDYLCRASKNGFELQYRDAKGNTRQQKFDVMSQEQ